MLNRCLMAFAGRRGRAAWKNGAKALLLTLALMCASGCATVPANKLPIADRNGGVMRQVMRQQNRIVHISDEKPTEGKPILLLLHGATDDPNEMMEIAREWSGEYEVFLYSFNFREPVGRVGADLVKEFKRLAAAHSAAKYATVVVYSYSAIVFRAAVINASDPSLFSGTSLVQLVPTAGGSRRAQWMAVPIFGQLAAWASKLSDAENPYGDLAKRLWDGKGNAIFYQAVDGGRMRTILVEGDSHSLANFRDKRVQRRFKNGIGPNVVTIPKSTGVTHEYFPTNHVALTYLRDALESLSSASLANFGPQAGAAAEVIPNGKTPFRKPDSSSPPGRGQRWVLPGSINGNYYID